MLRNIFISIIILYSIFGTAYAKDSLIPENNNKATFLEYPSPTTSLKINKERRSSHNKQLYAENDSNNNDFLLNQYIKSLPSLDDRKDLKNIKALSLPAAPTKKTASLKKEKTYELEELSPSIYFDHIELEFQKRFNCPVTPTLKNSPSHKPQVFNSSNNLRRYNASTFIATGEIIYIKGTLRDVNCTPIGNATVNLWQTDSNGNYKISSNSEEDFVGNGTAITNNQGDFEFITILPYSREEQTSPHFNVSIIHKEFGNVNTQIYFPLHIANSNDIMLNSLDKFHQTLLTSNLIPVDKNNFNLGYFSAFDITLNGISNYRSL